VLTVYYCKILSHYVNEIKARSLSRRPLQHHVERRLAYSRCWIWRQPQATTLYDIQHSDEWHSDQHSGHALRHR